MIGWKGRLNLTGWILGTRAVRAELEKRKRRMKE